MSRLTLATPAMSRAVSTVAAPVPSVIADFWRAPETTMVWPASASATLMRCAWPAVRKPISCSADS